MENSFPSLEPVPLKFKLSGRLRNIGKLKHWYMAIAEAIQNSMDSIHDSGHSGSITVEIQREDDLASKGGAKRPIANIIITDDGIGFNDANFESFSTPDSIHKLARGGKGLGRLMCLQAFNKIAVSSTYQNGDGSRRRDFLLQCEAPELCARDIPAMGNVHTTEVKLTSLRDEYAMTSTVDSETITDWLVEHFLASLVEKPKWLERLVISDGTRKVDLTKIVEGGAAWSEEFVVRNYSFRAICYSVTTTRKADMVRLVAGGRIVNANTQPLDFFLPHLSSISDSAPHLILIYSPFFDENVNDARNGVSFSEDGDGTLLGVTASEFRQNCGDALKKKLHERLGKSVQAFRMRVESVVNQEAQYYRPLLIGFFNSREFNNLSSSSRDEDILAALDAYKRRDAVKLRQESKRLARLHSESADYYEDARKLAEQIETQKQVALAEYVTLRKIVLDRLQMLIDATGEGKAHREAAIHNLIFPQRTDSDINRDINHQLWILDERLESHDYLASDQPIDGKRGDRPDLLVALDRPGAFAAEPFSKSSGYERMVIVEFKQALRDLATAPTDDLPHMQMMRYADQIVKGKAYQVVSKRPIKMAATSRFYMYAVCELSEAMLVRLETSGFTRSATGDGAFWVTNKGCYYIEYISLPKLLDDALARNSAFFRRLGLEG